MNEETFIQFAGQPLDSLPEGLKQQLQEDPQLKRALEDQLRMKSLLGLKAYETLDPRLSERVRRSVRVSISDYKPLGQRLSFQNAHLLPAWVRMVAVVVVMLGLSVLTHREMLRNELAEDALDLAREAEQGVELVATGDIESLQVSDLVHRDAFTTQLPDRFLFPLPDLAVQEDDTLNKPFPEPTVAPFMQNPMTLPVLYTPRPQP